MGSEMAVKKGTRRPCIVLLYVCRKQARRLLVSGAMAIRALPAYRKVRYRLRAKLEIGR